MVASSWSQLARVHQKKWNHTTLKWNPNGVFLIGWSRTVPPLSLMYSLKRVEIWSTITFQCSFKRFIPKTITSESKYVIKHTFPCFISWYKLVTLNFTQIEKLIVEINQDDTLSGDEASVDTTTEDNLLKLEEIGKNLLKKPASWVSLKTGLSEPKENGETNAETLTR